jgi:hypothetical protein
MAKRVLVAKTRNGGTQTESAFWSFIRSALRNKSRFWVPRVNALKAARRPSQSSNKKLKWEFQCSRCLDYHPQKNMEVHHEIEAGSLKCASDLPGFVERLFVETGWVCLCKPCHLSYHSKN